MLVAGGPGDDGFYECPFLFYSRRLVSRSVEKNGGRKVPHREARYVHGPEGRSADAMAYCKVVGKGTHSLGGRSVDQLVAAAAHISIASLCDMMCCTLRHSLVD